MVLRRVRPVLADQIKSGFERLVMSRLDDILHGRVNVPKWTIDGRDVYGRVDREVFASSGTFKKGDYPWARYILVRAVGGGGGGGGAGTTTSSQSSVGTGGGGGQYVEKLIPVGDLSASETVTIGAGGSGNAGAGGNSGGNTTFGSHITANGGSGGNVSTTTATLLWGPSGGAGGTGANFGDFAVIGDNGGQAYGSPAQSRGGYGGGTALAPNAPCNNASNQNGQPGKPYGGGGSGGHNVNSQTSTRTGGAGSAGVVIVDIYG